MIKTNIDVVRVRSSKARRALSRISNLLSRYEKFNSSITLTSDQKNELLVEVQNLETRWVEARDSFDEALNATEVIEEEVEELEEKEGV